MISFPATKDKGSFINIETMIHASIIMASLLFYSLYFDCGLNLWDEGDTPSGAMRVLDGELPYRDFWGYPPGQYLLFAMLFKLFGASLITERFTWLIITPFFVLLVYLIARMIMPRLLAFIPALLYLIAPGEVYARYLPMLTILNAYFLVRFCYQQIPRRLALVALAAAASSYFRWDVAGFAMITALFATILGHPKLTKRDLSGLPAKLGFFSKYYLTMLFIGILPFLLPCLLDKKLSGGVLMQISYILGGAYGKMATGYPPLFSLVKHILKADLVSSAQVLIYYFPYVSLGLTLALLALRFKAKGGFRSAENLAVVTLVIYAALSMNEVLWRSGFSNLVKTLPLIHVLVGWLLFRTVKMGKNARAWGMRAAWYLVAFSIICLVISQIWVFIFHHGYDIGSVGVLREKLELATHSRLMIKAQETENAWLKGINAFILGYTDEDDYIWCAPLNPMFYFLSSRRNPTYWEWLLPGWDECGYPADQAVRDGLIHDLESGKPKIIIISDITITDDTDSRFSLYALPIMQYIREKYENIESIGPFDIYRRKKYQTVISLADRSVLESLVDVQGQYFYDTITHNGKRKRAILQGIPSSITFSIRLDPQQLFVTELMLFHQQEFDLNETIICQAFIVGDALERTKIYQYRLDASDEVYVSPALRPGYLSMLESEGKVNFTLMVFGEKDQPIPEAFIAWLEPSIVTLML